MNSYRISVSRYALAFAVTANFSMAFASSAAVAQENPAPPTQDEGRDDPALDEAQDDPATTGLSEVEITVTGTRLRSGFAAPTPVTTISGEQLEQRGITNVADIINDIPAFRGSATPTSTPLTSGNAGGNYLNLRGLGVNRTLILLDNRRILPSITSSNLVGVNINVIPSVAIGNVEVVTGGASAAYGSDAVAGVANLLFNRRFQGLKIDTQAGITQYGDDFNYRAAFIAGTGFADDRGTATISAEYARNTDAVKQCSANRDWGCAGWNYYGNPADTSEGDGRPARITRRDVRSAGTTYGGLIVTPGPLFDIEFGPGGTVQKFQPGTERGSTFMVGGSGPAIYKEGQIVVPVERYSALATVDFNLTDNVRLYADLVYGKARAIGDQAPGGNFGTITIAADNAYLPAAVRQIMTANNIASFRLGRTSRDITHIVADVRTRTFRASGGVEFDFGSSWKLDVNASRTDDSTQTIIPKNSLIANFALAVDAVRDPASGQIVCRAALNLAALPAPLRAAASSCVPINLFGEGSPSQAAIDYVTADSLYVADGSQSVISATLTGEPFTLLGRPVAFAAGAERRSETADVKVDDILENSGFGSGNNKPFSAELSVSEAFVEAAVPLQLDWPVLQSIELNGAYRYTDYSISGSVSTWKAGAVVDLVPGLRLRGTRSRDIRAPNLRELFGGPISTFSTPLDPCDAPRQAGNANARANCAAAGLGPSFRQNLVGTVPAPSGGGNPNLDVEKADTLTAGIVLTPAFARNVRLSADYYDIKISDAISSLTTQQVLDFCYSRTPTPGSSCSAITRDSSGQLIRIESSRFNFAKVRRRGIDLEAQYTTSAPAIVEGSGRLSARLLATYQLESSSVGVNNTKIDSNGFFGNPKLQGTLSLTWSDDRVFVNTFMDYFDSWRLFDPKVSGAESIDDNHVPQRVYVDLSAGYKLGATKQYEFTAGVRNIFNTDPPIAPNGSFNTLSTEFGLYGDRALGRSFFIGARMKL